MRPLTAIAFVLLVLLAACWPSLAAAHPADRLKQHLVVGLTATEARLSLTIGGGILANELVLADLDPNGDGTVDDAERNAWIGDVLSDLRVTLDGRDIPLDPTTSPHISPHSTTFISVSVPSSSPSPSHSRSRTRSPNAA